MNDFFNGSRTALEAQAERWDMRGPVPMPKWEMQCPCCKSTDIQGREWTFHPSPSPESPLHNRCAISFKCRSCSLVFAFGVVVPDEMVAALPGGQRRKMRWRQVLELIETGTIA